MGLGDSTAQARLVSQLRTVRWLLWAWALGGGSWRLDPDRLHLLFPQDPCLSALLLDKLPACRPEAERRCDVCATRLTQLTREALQLLQAPASREDPDAPHGGPSLAPPGPNTAPSLRDGPALAGPTGRQSGRAGPDRRKGPAWPSGPSVQVSVAPAGLGGALSTVTIQAQQCLEGVWSVSRVNSFLPPTCLVSALRPVGWGLPGHRSGLDSTGLSAQVRIEPPSVVSARAGGLCVLGEAPDLPTARVRCAGKVTWAGPSPIPWSLAPAPRSAWLRWSSHSETRPPPPWRWAWQKGLQAPGRRSGCHPTSPLVLPCPGLCCLEHRPPWGHTCPVDRCQDQECQGG